MTDPQSLKIVGRWLSDLSALVRHGEDKPTRERLALYTSMLAADLPSGAFTGDSLRACVAGLEWWPAYDTIRQRAADWWREHKPPSAPVLTYDGGERLSDMDARWLRYFETRERENFAPLAAGLRSSRSQCLSLIRVQSPAAWRLITGERAPEPPTEEQRVMAMNAAARAKTALGGTDDPVERPRPRPAYAEGGYLTKLRNPGERV